MQERERGELKAHIKVSHCINCFIDINWAFSMLEIKNFQLSNILVNGLNGYRLCLNGG